MTMNNNSWLTHSLLLSLLACREVVTDLIEEYKAAERPDYVTWGGSTSGGVSLPPPPPGELKQDHRIKQQGISSFSDD